MQDFDLSAYASNQTSLSKIVRTIRDRAEISGLPLWDPQFYQNEIGHGRPELLTPEQKLEVIRITTQDRKHQEKESWQAIQDGDYENILPKMSTTTMENIMYKAGYARCRPGWKPPLTLAQERERLQWALDHNPDKDEEYDNKGYNFHKVVFTDETPACVGEQRGMIRAWCKEGEIYNDDVKKDRKQIGAALQFFGAFRYNHKVPCHVYYLETQVEIEAREQALKWENEVTQAQSNSSQMIARVLRSNLQRRESARYEKDSH
ncbi:hypothetical protein EJ02DRAFT_469986 [Clathrospora elynae]|uniref:Transposase Tc1-like domain-containing protein n=1 Tax=Clathrospora elynae TaxID=706981 RepID=A0A6A5SEV3_9PLEO|nr:hypothetical protein EJ02DRAFT_469986 [Clathrospora elynae]